MAKPVSHTNISEDDDVILEKVEPSFCSKTSSETIGLYLKHVRSNKKIDAVRTRPRV